MVHSRFLALALSWVDLILRWRLSPGEVDDAVLRGVSAEFAAALQDPNLSFSQLIHTFSLTTFEQQILLVVCALALDPRLSKLLVQLSGKDYLTLAAAMAQLDEGHGDVLSPTRPLRYWHLIEVIHPPEAPYTLGAMRIDERILHHVMGYDHLDERLQSYLFAMPKLLNSAPLPPSQDATMVQMAALVQGQPNLPVLQLSGIDTESKRLIVQQVASALDLTLYHLPTDLIPKASHELDLFARLWAREGALSRVALYLDAHELDPETQGEQVKQVQRFLARSGGLFFLSTRDAWSDVGLPAVTFDIDKPTTTEQETLWQTYFEDETIAARLAAQFNLSAPAISRVGATFEDNDPTIQQAWDACLVQTRPMLDLLAQRIEPKADWGDIVLPAPQMMQLREITAQVENRGVVFDQWGWRQRMTRGLGTTVLFGGESGTGKTFSAEILANHLNLNLYRIDLSQVVSKYIGETEKNLRKLFDAAEDGGAILFFDEADSLFGKRSEAKSSNDRYANMETNYLLQRLEQFRGLAILTTNLLNNIDDAFMRRVRFIIKFPVPEDEDRARIWQRIFPKETPMGEINYRHLSRFKMAGGSIYNAALNASFRAARDGGPVEMPHILEAVRMEFDKSGRLPQPRLFKWP
ncbi:MAG: ATP-binding protein [Candidatus Promineifilaceae bacterium]